MSLSGVMVFVLSVSGSDVGLCCVLKLKCIVCCCM